MYIYLILVEGSDTMTGEGITEIEFVDDGRGSVKIKKKKSETEILDDLIGFFGRSSKEVADYIEDENISPSFITPNRRIDLHPAYEYMLRVPRVLGDIVRLKKVLSDETDELDKFW